MGNSTFPLLYSSGRRVNLHVGRYFSILADGRLATDLFSGFEKKETLLEKEKREKVSNLLSSHLHAPVCMCVCVRGGEVGEQSHDMRLGPPPRHLQALKHALAHFTLPVSTCLPGREG